MGLIALALSEKPKKDISDRGVTRCPSSDVFPVERNNARPPASNGCGAGFSNEILKVLTPASSEVFKPCCDDHDYCYGTHILPPHVHESDTDIRKITATPSSSTATRTSGNATSSNAMLRIPAQGDGGWRAVRIMRIYTQMWCRGMWGRWLSRAQRGIGVCVVRRRWWSVGGGVWM